jgi:hypothetical protein
MESIRLVVPVEDGRWSVSVPGARRASSTHRERYDAVAVARRTLQNNGGGTIRVHDGDGDVVETHEVAAVRNRRVGDLGAH